MSEATIARGPVPAGRALELGGAQVALLAQRALWWPDEHTLFVADVHLGKAETFRARGVPVPAGPTVATLARLEALLRTWAARRLVVLGDLLHARDAQADATMAPFAAWRRRHAGLDLVLVRGNHDDRAGDPPAALGVRCVDAGTPLGPFLLCHEPLTDPACIEPEPDARGHRLAGHLHPAVRLHGRAGDSARLPCFVVGRGETVLPAFGDFTGCAGVPRSAPRRLVAIAGDRMFDVPRAVVAGA